MTSELQERIAKAIWSIRREEEDRCDMELEDMGPNHPVWREARAVMQDLRIPTPVMALAADKAVVAEYAANPEWEEAKDMAEGLVPARIYRAMLDAEIAAAEDRQEGEGGMSKINNGGAAFPHMMVQGHPDYAGGMSLRDYFAAQIASGMAAYSGTSGVSYGPGEIAGRSYQIADAMLQAREEQHDH